MPKQVPAGAVHSLHPGQRTAHGIGHSENRERIIAFSQLLNAFHGYSGQYVVSPKHNAVGEVEPYDIGHFRRLNIGGSVARQEHTLTGFQIDAIASLTDVYGTVQ